MVLTLSGCETKVTEISVVCEPGSLPTGDIHWNFTSKVDPSLLWRMPPTIDITLHYAGGSSRAVPPITTYLYRMDGAALRVASSAAATIPPKGTFTYHVDAGGYYRPLRDVGRGEREALTFVIQVDGSYFGGVLSHPTCGRWPDGHLELAQAKTLPDLQGKRPLNLGQAEWFSITTAPTAVMRLQGPEISTYAFFPAPITLTETKNETTVPDDVAKQEAEIGVTKATPIFTLYRLPTLPAGNTPAPVKGG
jgi:hypothetical protein